MQLLDLLPECLDALKYRAFWEHSEEPSLKNFLEFRLREDDLKQAETEHSRYKCELNTILKYHSKSSETGKKVQQLLINFQAKRQNVLAKIKWIEERRKFLEKEQNELRDQICLEQTRHVLDATIETRNQSLLVQRTITKKRLLNEPDISHEESNNLLQNEHKKIRINDTNENMKSDAEAREEEDAIDAIVNAEQTNSDEFESSVDETTEKSGKSKAILSWGHVADKIKISNYSDHDWLANGYNMSRDFRELQIKTVDRLKNSPTLSYASDIDEIMCLSSIMYVKEDKPKYINCPDQIWKDALHRYLTPITLPLKVRLFMLEYNTLLIDRKALREKWRQTWAECDDSMTEKEIDIFECVQLVTRNFFLNISSSNTDNNITMDEDTFVHRYCHLMLEEIFNTTNYNLVWANGESSSSKERRKSNDNKHGRNPDFRVLFGKEYEITFGEIKPIRAPNNVVNQSLVKLSEFMKGSLDSLHKQFGYSPCSETFGGLIKGCQVELFSMDLAFDGLYRFKLIGRMLLPTEDANFLNLVSVISNFYSLLEKVDRSIEELNKPSTPTGQSYHRESNSSPHKVHIPVLKIPPPAID